MRPYSFDLEDRRRAPIDLTAADRRSFDRELDDAAHGGDEGTPPRRRVSIWRWIMRGLGLFIILLVLAIGWLAITAPLSKSLQPPIPPRITLLADDGTPISRSGAIVGAPVDAAKLPRNVTNAFIAIEDRRFRSHWGIDPRGIARALFHNVRGHGVREGGSTITQQLAKNAFLDSDRTFGRKAREVLIAFWLEAWLSKDEILSRYLSNVYFGDNVYGLTAAARHYFNRAPAELSTGQAAMLAGLVKAPSRLAPTGNLEGARARQKLVVASMVDAGLLSKADAADVGPARLNVARIKDLPNGTYFADWVLPEARDRAGAIATEATVQTTLDKRLQAAAERAVKRAGLNKAQVALVAMRPDGRVVAMVGGKNYGDSPFNRATQARRQPGSAFKLFVYLAALRSGMNPDSMIDDEPVTISGWSPKNSDGRYLGPITLKRAFQKSSNVAAARIIQKVGTAAVIKAARDLGISTPIPEEATIALGTSTVSLLELTSAYAAVANGQFPVHARGLEAEPDKSWYQNWMGQAHPFGGNIRDEMMELLSASAESGTGREAALSVPTYGKTGTTQDSRDALFMGFANGLVCGVWVGQDDNQPNAGLSGGGVPARLWRDFMQQALEIPPKTAPIEASDNAIDPDAIDDADATANANLGIQGDLQGMGLNLHIGRNGDIQLSPQRDPGDEADRPPPPPRRRDDRPDAVATPRGDEE